MCSLTDGSPRLGCQCGCIPVRSFFLIAVRQLFIVTSCERHRPSYFSVSFQADIYPIPEGYRVLTTSPNVPFPTYFQIPIVLEFTRLGRMQILCQQTGNAVRWIRPCTALPASQMSTTLGPAIPFIIQLPANTLRKAGDHDVSV